MSIYFGDKIRNARKAKGLTQKQLAQLINVKNTAISNWENDLNKPDPDSIKLLCNVLNVPVSYFFESDEAYNSLDMQLKAIDFALYGEVKDLTEDEKQDILDFIKFKKSQRKE